MSSSASAESVVLAKKAEACLKALGVEVVDAAPLCVSVACVGRWEGRVAVVVVKLTPPPQRCPRRRRHKSASNRARGFGRSDDKRFHWIHGHVSV